MIYRCPPPPVQMPTWAKCDRGQQLYTIARRSHANAYLCFIQCPSSSPCESSQILFSLSLTSLPHHRPPNMSSLGLCHPMHSPPHLTVLHLTQTRHIPSPMLLSSYVSHTYTYCQPLVHDLWRACQEGQQRFQR